ncbi:alpha-mannosidase 2C1-like isoform X2 [Xenia sp. Carnegie-2017]|nr:alpha-mannosidase 2C1-like isoform X2 [Xenia sp. Carnegie-2017]
MNDRMESWGRNAVFKDRRCTLERGEKFISTLYFNDINLHSRLYPKKCPVTQLLHCPINGRFEYENVIKNKKDFNTVKVGDKFGPSWSTHWFKVTATIPEDWLNEEVHFRWNSNSEAMIWYDGRAVQGLSGSERTDYVLTESSTPNESFTFYIEMACNGLFGAGEGTMISPPSLDRYYVLSMANIAVFDRDCYQLIMDLKILLGMARHLPQDNLRASNALFVANDILNKCDVTKRETFKLCHELAERFFNQKNGEGQHVIHAIGHCHIDTAWLWPYEETKRKCARSWSSAIRIMEKYPEFVFACSQAQQFEWVKNHYPHLYADIKTFVKQGNFVPVGGTWVEMDGNIPGGESFIRQFLFGQSFFKEEFGFFCQEFWLPDTFGYSAQLPQIMRLAGIKYFVTQKLSWSLFNKFPHNSFIWEGIDGSRCLAHFPPGDTYESMVDVDDIAKTINNLKDKGRTNVSMLLYGYGDGGGGPTEEMMEKLNRMKDTNGLPKVVLSSPQTFFKILDEEDSSKLCSWVGELYLELHQGTFTAQAKIKDGNRRCEFLLHDLEFLAIIAVLLSKNHENKDEFVYPEEKLNKFWKLLLLNQFHDVLPGSCINEVVVDALRYYSDIKRDASTLVQQLLKNVTTMGKSNSTKTTEGSQLIAFNTHCWPRREVVRLSSDISINQFDHLETQKLKSGESLVIVDVPSMGYSVIEAFSDYAPCSIEIVKDLGIITMRNSFLTAKVDQSGRVVSLQHNQTKREIIAEGGYGNQFVIFDNIPLYWDAWDVMPYHLETRKELSDSKGSELEILEDGPLFVAVKFSLKISDESSITQVITLDAMSSFLSFETQVEWHENRKFLKVEFPVDIRSPNATYEIQFGHLQRPTHSNTSWDWARYEVCGQKWFNLSEHNFGCSLINDNKYGFSTRNNIMTISL